MSRYHCEVCRAIVDRPEKSVPTYKSVCEKTMTPTTMRRETKTKIERKRDV